MSRARIARIARACMVEALAQDDIRTARAKGLVHMVGAASRRLATTQGPPHTDDNIKTSVSSRRHQ
jgi:hypothetical protein